MEQQTIEEIALSWVNGNQGWVRKRAKAMSKMDFYLLVTAIESQMNVDDTGQLIWSLLGA